MPADNNPANWALSLALAGECPTLAQVHDHLGRDAIPVAMAMRREEREKARFRCTRAKGAQLNGLGWKVAHIRSVGLGYGIELESAPIQTIAEHFLRFMSPANMFVVPLRWAGLAELPELIEAISRVDENPRPI